MGRTEEFEALAETIKKGGAPKYHQANAAAGKLFCRQRIALLCDDAGKECQELNRRVHLEFRKLAAAAPAESTSPAGDR